MQTNDNFRIYYWCVFALLIVVGRLVLWLKVYPVLRKHDVKYKIGGFGDYGATAAYKRICIAEQQPLTIWYFLVIISCFVPVLVVGWFLLIWKDSFPTVSK